MIVVEIEVPFLSRSYEIELDETMVIGQAVEEMVEVICTKERWQRPSGTEKLELFEPGKNRRLSKAECFETAGIETGTRLILC